MHVLEDPLTPALSRREKKKEAASRRHAARAPAIAPVIRATKAA